MAKVEKKFLFKINCYMVYFDPLILTRSYQNGPDPTIVSPAAMRSLSLLPLNFFQGC